jgi:hypothetical protein
MTPIEMKAAAKRKGAGDATWRSPIGDVVVAGPGECWQRHRRGVVFTLPVEREPGQDGITIVGAEKDGRGTPRSTRALDPAELREAWKVALAGFYFRVTTTATPRMISDSCATTSSASGG